MGGAAINVGTAASAVREPQARFAPRATQTNASAATHFVRQLAAHVGSRLGHSASAAPTRQRDHATAAC